ncbi:hypothetical protein B0H17DRAFT_1205257 [Mycena rosella]|uniref:Uncharacterized protein n=1 Tax=Mycena rosella TaxID=1033263 RepID=A0AAD7D7F0_MYCRO|nr:hypothetical protein B0H17DRAFT_1205257 [Mycena rosella]
MWEDLVLADLTTLQEEASRLSQQLNKLNTSRGELAQRILALKDTVRDQEAKISALKGALQAFRVLSAMSGAAGVANEPSAVNPSPAPTATTEGSEEAARASLASIHAKPPIGHVRPKALADKVTVAKPTSGKRKCAPAEDENKTRPPLRTRRSGK